MKGKPDLFLRKATGLIRSWSVMDAFIYAFFSINLVTLGLYTISQAYGFKGGMIPALIISGILILAEIVVYAGLIAVMPRAGGDYVWQSRILGGGIGFVLAMTGWCFILWLWTPIYADMLRHVVLVPLAAVLGFKDAAIAIASSPAAWLAVCVFTCLFVLLVIALGMKVYARVQKVCFWVGNAGLVVVLVLLFAQTRTGFKAAFDASSLQLFGIADAHAAVEAAGQAAGASTPLSGGSISQVFLLMPFLAFFNLWPNWGATLYGEVKGSQDFKKNFMGMASALVVTTIPSGALVFIDGEERGKSPLTLIDLDPGQVSIAVRSDGYQDSFQKALVEAGKATQVVFMLKKAEIKIGDSYAGGIVFFLDGQGGGLVAAPVDLSSGLRWHNGPYTTTGATATGVGNGKANTARIVSSQGAGNYAAARCAKLSLGGFKDWFLPSKDELDLMYRNLKKAGRGGFGSAWYWSSSERSSLYAWGQDFDGGRQGNYREDNLIYVRAVRAFNN